MTKANTKQLAAQAERMGSAAHAAGAERWPGGSHELAALIRGRDVDGQCRLMAAWLRGWDRANVAAVVP